MTHFKLPLALISILMTSQMSEAKADHFRQIEGLATAAHVQAVGAVRYLKYNVDPVPDSKFLQTDIFDSYCGVASIEKASLFFSWVAARSTSDAPASERRSEGCSSYGRTYR